MSCPTCGTVTAESDAFCGSCGADLAQARATCSNCGVVNRPDSRFCTSCGIAVGAASAEPPAAAPNTPTANETIVVTSPPPPPQPAQVQGVPPAHPQPSQTTSPPPPPVQQVPADASPTGIKVTRPVSLVGAGVAVVGAFIVWLDPSRSAFDVPIPFLWDYQTTASDSISVGLLVVVLAAVAGGAAVVPSFGDSFQAARILGIALLAVAIAFNVQLAIAANEFDFVSFGDIYGIGPFVTGAGGIVLLVNK